MRGDMTTRGAPTSFRGTVGKAVQAFYPDVDRVAYARARWREVRARERAGLHATVDRQYPKRFAPDEIKSLDREPHVVVVPHEGESYGEWHPGMGNYYYEVAENLKDLTNSSRVSVVHIDRGEQCRKWQPALIEYVMDTKATHIITHVEQDPGSDATSWTWDSFWNAMWPRWDGVFIGSSFDAAYRFVSAKSRMLARMSPRFLAVDVGLPMAGSLKRGRFEVGPVNRPMSRETLRLIDEKIRDVQPSFDVTFLGVLYPYRRQLIEQLRSTGLSVAVNPHHLSGTDEGGLSQPTQPSWLDYFAGLRSGRTTINFSQSSAGPFEQLKWRVIEAGLAKTFLLTDDRHRTGLFWPTNSFGYFSDVNKLPQLIESVLGNQQQLSIATAAFAERAQFLARYQFWGSVQEGLVRRGLPGVGVEPFPQPVV